MLEKMWRKGNLLYCWRECKLVVLLGHKENEILPFAATWMDLGNMLSEVSQRKTNTIYNESQCICKTESLTDTENKLLVTKGEKEAGKTRVMGLRDINYYIQNR